ncbi:MAG: CRTAC1 family protein [Acidobacteriota bacterium]
MKPSLRTTLFCTLLLLVASMAWAEGDVTFSDIALNGGAGIDYERTPSDRFTITQDIFANGPYVTANFFSTVRPNSPQKPRGAPGVALLDYDDDGDLDIYVTNGPGTANSLYSNQFIEGGTVTFVDMAVAAGVDATALDSSGVCFGDTDNDGDLDLYVVSSGDPNVFFVNNGDGTFTDFTTTAGIAGASRHAVACTMADFDGNGYLDIYVGNSYDDWNHRLPVFGTFTAMAPIYGGMEHNYLFSNQGGNVFTDISAASGIENVSAMSGPGLTGASFTWAVGSADYDLDGDVDIFSADNQGAAAAAIGWVRVFENDGTGNFTDVTTSVGTNVVGGWMGIDFADFNCDGYMDFFVTDLGNYLAGVPSRWFLGGESGFSAPGVGDLGGTPFGWGTSTFDYDLDGDYDILYHGSTDILWFVVADNPGILLTNEGECSANFVYDPDAIVDTNHEWRNVQGVATGDLNNDYALDVVSVSSFDTVPTTFIPFTALTGPVSPVFDPLVFAHSTFNGAISPGFFVYQSNASIYPNGSLSIEINNAENGNYGQRINLHGMKGVTENGKSNRDGIGAVVTFETPMKGFIGMRPVVGGSSYASQNELSPNFGLGMERRGNLDILWPGGHWNRHYITQRAATFNARELPCNYRGDDEFFDFMECVDAETEALFEAEQISAAESFSYFLSAARAWFDWRI